MNYKLTIQYDGTRYKGWQRLGNGEATIQAKIEAVLSELAGEPIEIIGSSRTDAGVHALMQIANFKMDKEMTELALQKYMHQYLPRDISVVAVEKVDDRFHARYHTRAKTYVYKIWNEPYTNPFMRKYSMHVEKKLQLALMREAAKYFVGEHDFTTFSNAKAKKKSMVRTIHAIDIWEENGFVQIRVRGNGFLYNMVRKLVGTLIDVGLGRVEASSIAHMLEAKDRSHVHYLADAGGLYLESIEM